MPSNLALLLSGFFLTFQPAQEPPESETPGRVKMSVSLDDGSMFTGTLLTDPITLETKHGNLTVPSRKIRSIHRTKTGKEFDFTVADLKVRGRIVEKTLVFQTDFGTARVPASEIRRMHRGSHFPLGWDAQTRILIMFRDSSGSVVTRSNPPSSLVLVNGTVTREGRDGPCFQRKALNARCLAKFVAEENLLEGAFTIEIRVKTGAQGKSCTLLERHQDLKGTKPAFWLSVDKGQLKFRCSLVDKGSVDVFSKQGFVDANKWTYIAVTYDPSAGQLCLYADGKQIKVQKTKQISSEIRGSLVLGPCQNLSKSSICPEKIQFVRISSGARSPRIIAGIHDQLRQGSFVFSQRRNSGIALRGGGFLAGRIEDLAGIKFTTSYGTLEFGSAESGSLLLSPYRKDDLRRVRLRVPDLIHRLNAESIADREDAQQALQKIGAPAIQLLRKAVNSEKGETQARSKELLRQFETSGEANRRTRDELHLGGSVLHGWLEAKTVTVRTKYGSFHPELRNIRKLFLGPTKDSKIGTVLTLKSGERLKVPPDWVLSLKTEFGLLRVKAKDIQDVRHSSKKKMIRIRTKQAVLWGRIAKDRFVIQTGRGTLTVPASEIVEEK